MPLPDLQTVPVFYHNYISLIEEENLQAAIENHLTPLLKMLQTCSEDNWNYSYATGKWSLKELVQHVIDSERIFSHRALCIARQDPNPLPSFDENNFAKHSVAQSRSGPSLLQELDAVNQSTIALFGSFSPGQLAAVGVANNAPITVNAIGYIICGHALHHTGVVRERYMG